MRILQEPVLKLDLQIFADGGGGAAAAAPAAGGDTGGPAAGGAGAKPSGAGAVPQTKGGKSNPLANVVYGKQAEVGGSQDPAGSQTVPTGPADTATPNREAEFQKLIKGEYKDLYDAQVQNIVQNRLKNVKDTADKYTALEPVLELIAKKYGVKSDDTQAIIKAMEDDDAYYEEEAIEKGLTVEQVKEYHKISRENSELKRQLEEQQTRENANRLYASWMQQAQETKTIYPGFDLNLELQNPKFVDLLKANVNVRTAYEVIHQAEIIPALIRTAESHTEKAVVDKIAAKGMRPAENGTSPTSTATVKTDVSQLTKADRQEIARRVARGERISF